MQQTGAKSKLMIGFESAYNTIATAGFIMPFNSSGVKASRNQSVPGTIRDSINPSEPFDGNTSVGGAIAVPLDSVAFGVWLKAMFGDPTTSGSGPYTHEFKAGNARSSITIEHQFPSLDGGARYFQYTGCKVAGWSIAAGDDGELLANLDIVGSTPIIASTSFDESPTVMGLSRLKNNQLALQEGGSTINHAKLVDMAINTPVDADQYVIGGGGTLGDAPDITMAISGNLNTLFKDTSLLEKALNSTESSMQATFTGSASSALDILLPELKYSLNDPGIDGPKGMAVSLPFSAYYNDATEATSAVITLTSTETTY